MSKTCEKCGAEHGDSRRCYYVDMLGDLAGIDLTSEEDRYLRWLASLDAPTVDAFRGLFRRLRTGHRNLARRGA